MSWIEEFEKSLYNFSEEDRKDIMHAAEWAEKLHRDQKRASGEPYIIHPLHVAKILIDMKLDSKTVIGALLHDILEDTGISRSEIRKRFGKQVETLVNGVTKISILKAKSKSIQQAETIRKMLFAMIKDIRVIFIKLADKLHNMSTLEHLPPAKKKSIATECLDIYAPLAGRLGISWMKAELEDLSLKHLFPEKYNFIKESMAATKSKRKDYLTKIERDIYRAAQKQDLQIDVTTRAKHFNSIYRKMKTKAKKFDEIYDLLGIRIICNTDAECYTLLGIIHRLWLPIEGRFKDYIAMPKANKYQSLHTTVMCYGKLIEVQIRTHEMHRTAEFGVAAHWLYKNALSRRNTKNNSLPLIAKLKRLDNITSNEFLNDIKHEILLDSIYVFTPGGDVIELPKRATAIDFAYHIHTEVGNHCIAAKADGAIIPLGKELKNTQVIEIITSSKARPHLNWLRYTRTRSARSKIRQWLNKHDDNLIIDRSIVAKKNIEPDTPASSDKKDPKAGKGIIKRFLNRSKVMFKIANETNMMISIAKCCSPSTGDSIIGYISRGRGIIVHTKNCWNLKNINDFSNRRIDVEWESPSPKTTKEFKVTSAMTPDLFSEIEAAIKKYNAHIIGGNLQEDNNYHLTGSFITVLEKNEDFKKVIKSIRNIPSIINIKAVL